MLTILSAFSYGFVAGVFGMIMTIEDMPLSRAFVAGLLWPLVLTYTLVDAFHEHLKED